MAASASERKLSRLWRSLGIPADYSAARALPLQREARTLVRIGRSPTGRVILLTPRAAAAWRKMEAAARADGLTLLPVSGFRSIARQTRLIRQKLAGGASIERILALMAAPGCSEHHTGRAVDVGRPGCTELTTGFGRTPEYRWLAKHARSFGFVLSYPRRNRHRIGYEPWHWCWQGQKR